MKYKQFIVPLVHKVYVTLKELSFKGQVIKVQATFGLTIFMLFYKMIGLQIC